MANITASIAGAEIARALLMIQRGEFCPEGALRPVSTGVQNPSRYGIQHFAMTWAHPHELDCRLEQFFENVALPLAQGLVPGLLSDANWLSLELPRGIDSAEAKFGGLILRCCIDRAHPISEFLSSKSIPWTQDQQYYSIETDEWKFGPCGIVIRADMARPV